MSNHPEHIFKNIIKSLLIRLRRICSNFSDYLYFSAILSNQLISRGYDLKIISKCINMVARLRREDLLQYKKREKIDYKTTFTFKLNFDKNMLNINDIIHSSFNNLKNTCENVKGNKIMIINEMQYNLSSLLIHNFKLQDISKNRFIRCLKPNCLVCKFSNNSFYVKLTEYFSLPISSNSSCNSENVIYIIHCKFCNAFYVGQTCNVFSRFYSHLYTIRKFIAYKTNVNNVSAHFNLKFHNYIRDFEFYILKTNINSINERLEYEAFIINLIMHLNTKIINGFIPEIKDTYRTDKK